MCSESGSGFQSLPASVWSSHKKHRLSVIDIAACVAGSSGKWPIQQGVAPPEPSESPRLSLLTAKCRWCLHFPFLQLSF